MLSVTPLLPQVTTGSGNSQFAALVMGDGTVFVSGAGCTKAVAYGRLVSNAGVITVSGVNLTPFGSARPDLVPANAVRNALIALVATQANYDAVVANLAFSGVNFVGS
jgi:hypothetical protein